MESKGGGVEGGKGEDASVGGIRGETRRGGSEGRNEKEGENHFKSGRGRKREKKE